MGSNVKPITASRPQPVRQANKHAAMFGVFCKPQAPARIDTAKRDAIRLVAKAAL